MQTERRVVLYGDTVVLAGVGRALSTCSRLRVISRLDPSLPTSLEVLDSLRPCAVILDLAEVTAESAIALARGRPDLLLIGLSSDGEGMLVLPGEQARGISTEGLVRLIEAGVPLAGEADNVAAMEVGERPPDLSEKRR